MGKIGLVNFRKNAKLIAFTSLVTCASAFASLDAHYLSFGVEHNEFRMYQMTVHERPLMPSPHFALTQR